MNLHILLFIELLAEYPNLIDLQFEQVRLRVLFNYLRLLKRRLIEDLAGLNSESLQGLVPALQTQSIGLLRDRFVRVGTQGVVQALVQADGVINCCCFFSGGSSGEGWYLSFVFVRQSLFVRFATEFRTAVLDFR